MQLAWIVLAAGHSRRMGFPKALLDLGGASAVRCLTQTIERTRSTPNADHPVARSASDHLPDALVVVANEETARALAGEIEGLDPGTVVATVVRNPEPETGRTGSVQIGLDTIDALEHQLPTAPGALGGFAACMIWPVDAPRVEARTLLRLLHPQEAGTHSATPPDRDAALRRCRRIPTHGNRGGHPLLIGREWWPQIRALGRDQSLRNLLAIRPEAVERLEVADAAVLWNLDTPADVQRCLGRPARPVLPSVHPSGDLR